MNTTTAFKVGDQVKILFKSQDAKSRITPFEGVVIALRGAGDNRTFIVRKIAVNRIAVERIFPLHSPLIEEVKVVGSKKVRRAKLYYLRKQK